MRPTVKVLDEPSPVPREGMSAMVVISTPPSSLRHSKVARTSRCSIAATESTSSVLE